MKGIPLPIGADLNNEPIAFNVSVHKNYILAETQINNSQSSEKMHGFKHYSTYDP